MRQVIFTLNMKLRCLYFIPNVIAFGIYHLIIGQPMCTPFNTLIMKVAVEMTIRMYVVISHQ